MTNKHNTNTQSTTGLGVKQLLRRHRQDIFQELVDFFRYNPHATDYQAGTFIVQKYGGQCPGLTPQTIITQLGHIRAGTYTYKFVWESGKYTAEHLPRSVTPRSMLPKPAPTPSPAPQKPASKPAEPKNALRELDASTKSVAAEIERALHRTGGLVQKTDSIVTQLVVMNKNLAKLNATLAQGIAAMTEAWDITDPGPAPVSSTPALSIPTTRTIPDTSPQTNGPSEFECASAQTNDADVKKGPYL